MVELLISSAAELEYAEALNWYANRDIYTAEGFDAEFDLAIQTIFEDPDRFPRCDESHHFYLMRRFPYQLIFRKTTDHWVVIAVAHTSRKPRFWADR
jgi:toxin ParE1/3/4